MKDPAALLQRRVRGRVLRQELLARHTSLKVGGPADWFVEPADLADLRELLAALAELGMPSLVIGGGYNLLVRDGGVRGAVISLSSFNRLEQAAGGLLHGGAGVENRHLVTFCRDQGLSGLEFLVGIPGRLGGALAMNAGAADQAIMDRLELLVTLREGAVAVAHKQFLEFGYRQLRLAAGEIILEAVFRMETDDPCAIDARLEALLAHRRTAQMVGFPNAGSFFKNPPAGPAWRYIDAAGLRGVRIGGAQVSEVHTNFLVNRGGATAADFLALAALIKEKVRESAGIELEEEVRIVGAD